MFEDGFLCVLECLFINIYLLSILINDMFILRIYIDFILIELFSEVEGINMFFILLGKLVNWLEFLIIIEDNIDLNVLEIGVFVIRRLIINVFENIVFILLFFILGNNRFFYVVDNIVC